MSWHSSFSSNNTSTYDTYAASLNGKWQWKDSYRWVDFEEITCREIDSEITDKWLNTSLKKFTFKLTTGTYFSQSSNSDIYSCEVTLNYSRSSITSIQQINKNSYYKRNMKRIPPFQLPSGNSASLGTLFDKHYADVTDPTIMSETGMFKFFKDCSIDPDSYETLIISYHLKSSEMGIYARDEFISGFCKSGCSNKNDIKKCIQSLCRNINNNNSKFKQFYRWIFNHVKEDNKKKSISNELSIQLWNILFQKEKYNMIYFNKWIEYCNLNKNNDLKVISKDLWNQIFDFLKETKSINNYDDAGGSWPVAIDEFVEYLQQQQKQNK